MDPRLLLGVSARAGRAEVRAAHRRLRRAVDPSFGGTPELVRLVDEAAALLGGTAAGARGLVVPPEPSRVLGVPRDARAEVVHAAYRRVSRTVHPDRGGTDELFRVVEAARRSLLAPPTTARTRAAPPRWEPPPPPRPRGPYRAPPPEERHVVATWRAVRDLAWYGSILAAATATLIAAFSLGSGPGIFVTAAVIVSLVLRVPVLQPAVEGVLRASIVLLGARVRVAEEVAPERFLEASCLDAPVGRSGEEELYAAYVRWCASRGTEHPVAPWIFVERLRTLGLLLVKPSAWEKGLWVGITLRKT